LPPAFTLVEILVVISIIMVLAAMTIGGLGFVRRKAAEGRTDVLLGSISQALEQYRADNGFFPEGDGGEDSTEQVYIALYGDGELEYDQTTQKVNIISPADGTVDPGAQVYLDILNPENKKVSLNVDPDYNIVDAWREPIHYRHSISATAVHDKMMNPSSDFDLWSLGADGEGGPKGDSASTGADKEKARADDLKNW